MNPNTPFTNSLTNLSDDPILRGMQIALAAVDERLTADDVEDDQGLIESYEALHSAIVVRESELSK